jgi:CheY-like chemotaxis protein
MPALKHQDFCGGTVQAVGPGGSVHTCRGRATALREAAHAVLKRLKRKTVVLEASNSRQAIQIVEKHPDLSLVLLDIKLPDRDGFSVERTAGPLPGHCDHRSVGFE